MLFTYIDDIANIITIGLVVVGIYKRLKRQRHGFFIITILYMLCMFTLTLLLITGHFSMDGMEKHQKILVYIIVMAMAVHFSTIWSRWFP